MCINILAENQGLICVQFSGGTGQDFTEIDWSPAGNGAPRLHHTVATIEADLEFEYGTGDDAVVTAHVTALTSHGGRPLVFPHRPHGLAWPATDLD